MEFYNKTHFELYLEFINKVDPMEAWLLKYRYQLGKIQIERE